MRSDNRGSSVDIAAADEEEADGGHRGTFEIERGAPAGRQRELNEMEKSWLLRPPEAKTTHGHVNLGCVVVKRKVLRWVFWCVLAAFLLVGLPVLVDKTVPRKKLLPPPADRYTVALHKALLFFNAQKSGRLTSSNGIPWRGDSGLSDGSDVEDLEGGLVGGYYDAGNNVKFHFPMAFSMTLLSWSTIEYSARYKAIGEYDHVRELIKWGADYLMLTFNSSAPAIDHVYAQVGVAKINGSQPDDRYCWNRPEDMAYSRPSLPVTSAPDLGGEIAAALAAASIVFRDDADYSMKLVHGAATIYNFARDSGSHNPYSLQEPDIAPYYSSSGFWDEYIWAAAWMYYATGNDSFAMDQQLPKNAKAFDGIHNLAVFSWDNKLPGVGLLLSRTRMFLNPGYPKEELLAKYQKATDLNMCMYLPRFASFNFSKGGLALFDDGMGGQPLQLVVSNAFLAALYADYLEAIKVPGWFCGPNFVAIDDLRTFARSQVDYVLGANPRSMSYIVDYGDTYPRHLHHRGASTPNDGVKYSCTGGYKWRDSKKADPNLLTGAMVGGPDRNDEFDDSRNNWRNEPTLVGNAGLVAALVAITNSGRGVGVAAVDRDTMFATVPPMSPPAPPPPYTWRP
ncbi:hypothetical protein ACP70R_011381 [Stipagrostis hirtigluma subsp. patula]